MKDVDALLAPIEGDDPGGPYLRYDPVYDEIKEARREDPELPQGEWKRERKVADWSKVVSLASSTLQERSKDLQVAAWLLEGWLRREGYPGLEAGLRLLVRLHREQWDHLHPRVEDPDDLEFRAVPLEWVGDYLEPSLRAAPLNDAGHTLGEYEEARRMGTEEEAAGNSDREAAREEAIADGRPVMEDFLDAFDATPKPWVKEMAGAVEGSREALAELDEVCTELYEDVPPSFLGLREALEGVSRVTSRLLQRKLEQDPDPVEEAPVDDSGTEGEGEGATPGDASPGGAAAAVGEGSGPGRPSGGSAGRPAPAPDSADGAAAGLAAAARWMRRDDPTNPAPYLVLRAHRWGELRAGGDALDPRLLEAPPTDTRTRLKTLLLDGEWAELLDAAEEVMATPWGRGWLDLQRYVVTALDHLGSDYDAVVAAVTQSLQGLLEVRPGLLEMTLMDDSPTANRETLGWLEEALPGRDGVAVTASPAVRPGQDPGRTRSRAEDRLRAGQPREAIQLLLDAATREDSARERFLRRSEATRIMVDEGMQAVALPILEEMMEQVERHSLEDWEAGDTVAGPLSLLYHCLDTSGADPSRQEQLYLRICRLDPMEGMRLKSGDGSAGGGGAAEAAAGPAEGSDGA